MDNSISQDLRQLLKNKIHSSKKVIESMLKQFKYQQDNSLQDNMKKLCSCLQNVMNVQSLYDFYKFLSNDQHLPIEINFKALKYEKLVQIFQDWLISKQDHISQGIQRTITHKHRNILFKRILIQQKDTIKQYFQTLSEKKKLKGFDLFQLLTELLGPYFLYQFNADFQTFFEKVNSFQHFTKVVESFIKNGIRIYNKDRQDPNDESYIRYNQLEALIQFWELTNPELIIQENARKNMNDASIQTILVNSVTSEAQTDKESPKVYINVINRTLRDINSLIQVQNDPEVLQSLDKILDILRSQKIFITSYNSQKFEPRKLKNIMLSSQHSQTQPCLIVKPQKTRLLSPQKARSPKNTKPGTKILAPNMSVNSNSNSKSNLSYTTFSNNSQKQEDDCKIIFRYLCSKDKLNCLTLDLLHDFFCELGLIQHRDTYFVQRLVSYGYIQDQNEVSMKEFKNILRQVMKEDKRLGAASLKKYIAIYIDSNQLRATAYFKATQNQHSLLINQERSFRQQSRTTYPMDSEGSVI